MSTENNKLRRVKVVFDNGDVINTSMAAHLTDEEILDYYKVGKVFNLGSGELDNLQKVKEVILLDKFEVGQPVLTPHGKAKVIMVDNVDRAVRVEHLEASTPITDYRFVDLEYVQESIDTDTCKCEVIDGECQCEEETTVEETIIDDEEEKIKIYKEAKYLKDLMNLKNNATNLYKNFNIKDINTIKESISATTSIELGEEEWSIILENVIEDDNYLYIIDEVHIDDIVHGDTVIHKGEMKTVSGTDIGGDKFMGKSIFGDSYKSGHELVKRVNFKTRDDINESLRSSIKKNFYR